MEISVQALSSNTFLISPCKNRKPRDAARSFNKYIFREKIDLYDEFKND